jgi:hypothetical protein
VTTFTAAQIEWTLGWLKDTACAFDTVADHEPDRVSAAENADESAIEDALVPMTDGSDG